MNKKKQLDKYDNSIQDWESAEYCTYTGLFFGVEMEGEGSHKIINMSSMSKNYKYEYGMYL